MVLLSSTFQLMLAVATVSIAGPVPNKPMPPKYLDKLADRLKIIKSSDAIKDPSGPHVLFVSPPTSSNPNATGHVVSLYTAQKIAENKGPKKLEEIPHDPANDFNIPKEMWEAMKAQGNSPQKPVTAKRDYDSACSASSDFCEPEDQDYHQHEKRNLLDYAWALGKQLKSENKLLDKINQGKDIKPSRPLGHGPLDRKLCPKWEQFWHEGMMREPLRQLHVNKIQQHICDVPPDFVWMVSKYEHLKAQQLISRWQKQEAARQNFQARVENNTLTQEERRVWNNVQIKDRKAADKERKRKEKMKGQAESNQQNNFNKQLEKELKQADKDGNLVNIKPGVSAEPDPRTSEVVTGPEVVTETEVVTKPTNVTKPEVVTETEVVTKPTDVPQTETDTQFNSTELDQLLEQISEGDSVQSAKQAALNQTTSLDPSVYNKTEDGPSSVANDAIDAEVRDHTAIQDPVPETADQPAPKQLTQDELKPLTSVGTAESVSTAAESAGNDQGSEEEQQSAPTSSEEQDQEQSPPAAEQKEEDKEEGEEEEHSAPEEPEEQDHQDSGNNLQRRIEPAMLRPGTGPDSVVDRREMWPADPFDDYDTNIISLHHDNVPANKRDFIDKFFDRLCKFFDKHKTENDRRKTGPYESNENEDDSIKD